MSAGNKIAREIAAVVDLRSLRAQTLALLEAHLREALPIDAAALRNIKLDTGATLWEYAVEVADVAIQRELRKYRAASPPAKKTAAEVRRTETPAEAAARRAQRRAIRIHDRHIRADAKRARAQRAEDSRTPRRTSSAETSAAARSPRNAEARALAAAEGAHLLGEDADQYIDRHFPDAGQHVRNQARRMGAHAAALTSNRPYTADSDSDSMYIDAYINRHLPEAGERVRGGRTGAHAAALNRPTDSASDSL